MSTRWLPALVLAAIVAVYLPSLSGGLVWDDHFLLAGNPAIGDPWRLVSESVWGPTGRPGDLYRPLTMLLHAPIQALWPGPALERGVSLGLHLGCAAAVACLARGLGAGREAAWLAAAVFGLHPAASEAAAWITGRHDLLPAALALAAAAAWRAGRGGLAGLLLGLTPLCKESYLLAPAAAALWCAGDRRLRWGPLPGAAAGVALTLALRQVFHLPLPAGAALTEPLAAIGAVALRGLELAIWPAAPDAQALYSPAPLAGAAAVALGLLLLVASWGRPAVAALTGGLVLLAPTAPASAQLGLVADRYYYLPLALALAAAAPALDALLSRGRAARALWLLPPLLAAFTAPRAAAWSDDASVFAASLARDPDNPRAAFHVAYDLHTRADDCAGAVPLYRRALEVEPRAATNLQACLLDLGELEEAAALGARLTGRDAANPNPAANTARALARLGRAAEAASYAEEATRRAPERADLFVLLGNTRGMAGDLAGAGEAFQAALELDPGSREAAEGLAKVRAKSP